MKNLVISACAAAALLSGSLSVALAEGHEGAHAKSPYHNGKHCKKPHGKCFDKMDADGDGVVTAEEHRAFSTERFGKMDADGDGKVTKDEAEAYHKAKHEKHKEHHEENAAEE